MKHSNLYKILFLTLGVFTTLSCSEDFLERKPIDTLVTGNFYLTEEGITKATNAIYAPLGEEGFNGKTMWMIGDGASDDAQPNGTDPTYIPIDQFSISSDNPEIARLWQVIYRIIALSNLVLENVEGNSAGQDVLDRCAGEAHMLRGYAYFMLVRIFSDVPLVLDGMSATELEDISRSSAYDVYTAIINDFERAIDLLPTKSEWISIDPNFTGKVSKHAAMGMLAKVYLTLAGDLSMYDTESNSSNSTNLRSLANTETCYNNALDLCNQVIQSGEYRILEDYEQVFKYDGSKGGTDGNNCAESIWQIQFVGCGTRYGSGNMMQSFWAPYESQITGFDDGWGTHSPHEDLAACFYDDPDSLIQDGNTVDSTVVPPGDKRFYWTLMFPGVEYPSLPNGAENTPYVLSYGYGASGFAAKKYVIGKASSTACRQKYPNNTYLLRYADVQLMKAECHVELNQVGDAASSLDEIRTRAGKPLLDGGMGQSAMRDAVRLERRRELALEQSRWFDILRWGIAYDVLAAQDIILLPDRRLFPIPSTEIALNKNLTQNRSY